MRTRAKAEAEADKIMTALKIRQARACRAIDDAFEKLKEINHAIAFAEIHREVGVKYMELGVHVVHPSLNGVLARAKQIGVPACRPDGLSALLSPFSLQADDTLAAPPLPVVECGIHTVPEMS